MDNQSTPVINSSRNKQMLLAGVAFVVIALIVLLGIFVTRNSVQNTNNDNSTQTELTQNLSVIVKTSETDSKEYSLMHAENENVIDMLTRLDNSDEDFSFGYQEFEGIGAFVNELNGKQADGSTEFWSFMINGEMAQVGPSSYTLNKGDVISFELTKIEIN